MNLASYQIPSPQGLHSLVEYALPLQVESKGQHFIYQQQLKAEDGRVFTISIYPDYCSGTLSLLDSVGSARIEISEVREDDFMKYRVAYMDTVRSRTDLGRDVVYKLTKALCCLKIISEFDLIRLDFKQHNRRCTITV